MAMLLTLTILLLTPACNIKDNSKMKREIEAADKECPINMGIVGDVISIKYDEDNNLVKIYISINEEVASIMAMKKNVELAKKSIKLALNTSKSRPMVDEMIAAGSGLEIIYKGSSSGKSFTLNLSPDDIKGIQNSNLTDLDIKQMMLENQIVMANSQYPEKIDEGMEIVKMYDDGDNIVYECVLDENMYDIALIKTNGKYIKKNMSALFDDPMMKRMIDLMCSLGKNLVFRYIGDKSNQSGDITFTTDEMNKYRN